MIYDLDVTYLKQEIKMGTYCIWFKWQMGIGRTWDARYFDQPSHQFWSILNILMVLSGRCTSKLKMSFFEHFGKPSKCHQFIIIFPRGKGNLMDWRPCPQEVDRLRRGAVSMGQVWRNNKAWLAVSKTGCTVYHPLVIKAFIGGINKPFPVMGGLWHCFTHINLLGLLLANLLGKLRIMK